MNLLNQEIFRLCLELQYKNPKVSSPFHPSILNELINISIDCPEKPESFNFEVVESEKELYDSICLTSGGADSTIAWYLKGKPPGLYINIGQPYRQKELNVLEHHNITHHKVSFPNLFSKTWKHIIPARNLLFLTVAASYIKEDGEIYFGVTDGEGWNSGKGDKSFEFVNKFLEWYFSVTGKSISITTFEEHTKAGWLKEFKAKGYDIDLIRYHTVTCFSESEKPCGKCQSCLRKYLSFVSAFDLDTFVDYEVHPMIGCKEYVDKYKVNLHKALEYVDYSHYSYARCIEDLDAIEKAKSL